MLASLTALALALLPAVQAINQYPTIGNVGKPAHCGNSGTLPQGSWITNKACGYVMGTSVSGSHFDVSNTDSYGFHYGRFRSPDGHNFCAVILPGSLDTAHPITVADSCSTSTQSTLCDSRYVFGKDFDAAPHTGDGSTIVSVNLSGCTGYFNYFDSSSFDSGVFRDPVNVGLPSGGYRYTTKDGVAAMVHADLGAYGGNTWFFVDRNCIASQLANYRLDNTMPDSCSRP
ncbi:hypothetical protein CF327_g2219 [Tilletia walkeri]|uniref:Uncharacterized protein n=1 Tax=Tilletia walkeri TaxID=117179 RepID=A0A8X7NAU5_9BASI|nr:hypothetical protein CF327_g2219 [Tilletia walkeri]KAE8268611.1 hypothetical protein A4X09_0g3729 [Tilletia walkeri]